MCDWQKGDLALCVAHPYGGKPAFWNPSVGGVYTVAEFRPEAGGSGFLELEEDPDAFEPEAGWEPLCFRKVTPPKADEFDREVIDLMLGKKVPHHA